MVGILKLNFSASGNWLEAVVVRVKYTDHTSVYLKALVRIYFIPTAKEYFYISTIYILTIHAK